MRLPGFLHRKGEPFLSQLVTCNTDRVYTRAQLIAAFGPIDGEPTKEAQLNSHAQLKHGKAVQLAGQAIARVERDKSRGRHKQALALGLACREAGLSAEAAAEAAEVFHQFAPDMDSDGEPRPLTPEEVRSAVLHAYDESVEVKRKKELSDYVLLGPELPKVQIPPRRVIVDPFISESSLAMIFAKRGVGKTWFALELARACSTGTDFFKWKVERPHRVLYVDGEMPLSLLKDRTVQLFQGDPPEEFMLLPSETLYLEDRPLRINHTEHQQRFAEALEDLEASDRRPELIIFDNISSLTSGLDENSNSDLDQFLDWQVQLRHSGFALVFVHHAGKNGNQRGASRREDLLDTVIKLDELGREDFARDEGANFTISFDKVRGIRPKPDLLTVSLVGSPTNDVTWAMGADRQLTTGERVLMEIQFSQPTTQVELAEKVGVTPSRISQVLPELRMKKWLTARGLQLTPEGYGHLKRVGLQDMRL